MERGRKLAIVTAIVTAVSMSGVAGSRPANAAAGTLDPAWGTDGTVVLAPRKSVAEQATVVAAIDDGDGTLVLINADGSPFVMRLNAQHRLDHGYGQRGQAELPPGVALAFAKQDDGSLRVLRAGWGFTVAAIHADGRLDTTFGGDGIVPVDGTAPGTPAATGAVTTDDDGFIVGYGNQVVRITAHGALDRSFGTGGRVEFDRVAAPQETLADGGLLVVLDGRFIVVLNPDGSARTNFAGDGSLDTRMTGTQVTADGDGFLAAGTGQNVGGDCPTDVATRPAVVSRYGRRGQSLDRFGSFRVLTSCSTQRPTFVASNAPGQYTLFVDRLNRAGTKPVSTDGFRVETSDGSGSVGSLGLDVGTRGLAMSDDASLFVSVPNRTHRETLRRIDRSGVTAEGWPEHVVLDPIVARRTTMVGTVVAGSAGLVLSVQRSTGPQWVERRDDSGRPVDTFGEHGGVPVDIPRRALGISRPGRARLGMGPLHLAADGTVTGLASEYDDGAEALLRWRPDGTLDPMFSGDGVLPLQAEFSNVQFDGRGRLMFTTPQFPNLLIRLGADGSLDATFGVGGAVDARAALFAARPPYRFQLGNFCIGPTGRIIVGVSSRRRGQAWRHEPIALDPNGSLVSGFDADDDIRFGSCALTGDNRAVLALPGASTVHRLLADGSSDPVAADGTWTISGAPAAFSPQVFVDALNRTIWYGDWTLARILDPIGIDTDFGTFGLIEHDRPVHAVTVDPDGRPLIALKTRYGRVVVHRYTAE